MNVLYHLPILPPKMPAAEAFSQEIAALQTAFPGEIVYLNPNDGSPIPLPRLLFGWHRLRRVRAKEATTELHHFFNPDPFAYPVLLALRRPVVYSLTSGLGDRRVNLAYFSRLAAVTVYDEASDERLRSLGLTNVHRVQSGVDVGRFTHTPQPLTDELRLLVASAPWTEGQFITKGVDALLAAARQHPTLRLTFLWRGHLYAEMMARVARAGAGDRVRVIDGQVDVNAVLADMHGAINLAADGGIIKAYPHSLLDSLAAGKPVMVSRAIAMSEYVAQTGCGLVVDGLAVPALVAAMGEFTRRYGALAAAAEAHRYDFSQTAMIDSFRAVYEVVVP